MYIYIHTYCIYIQIFIYVYMYIYIYIYAHPRTRTYQIYDTYGSLYQIVHVWMEEIVYCMSHLCVRVRVYGTGTHIISCGDLAFLSCCCCFNVFLALHRCLHHLQQFHSRHEIAYSCHGTWWDCLCRSEVELHSNQILKEATKSVVRCRKVIGTMAKAHGANT